MFATKDLSDAIDVTRAFLAGATLGTWIKLAIIVFFVGGVGFGGPTFPGGGGGGEFEGEPTPGAGTDPGAIDVGEILPALIVLGAFALAIYLVFSFLGALFEFVLLESLRSGEVHVRRYGSRNVSSAVHLFGFRLVIDFLALAVVGGPLLAFYLLSGDLSGGTVALVVLLAIPVYLVYAVVQRFTTVFVAPTMLKEELGVVAAWKRFWTTLTDNWKEYLVYLLLVWLVQLVLTFAIGIVLLVVILVLAIPLILIALIPIVGIIVILLMLPVFVLILHLVQVPLITYLRYYALLVLGDTDAELDLIPDQRAAVRGGDGPGSGGSTGGWASDDDGDDGSDSWGSDDDGDDRSSGWDSDDDRGSWDSRGDGPDDGTLGGDDGSDSGSWDGPDTWGDSSESDDDGDDRDGW